MKDKDFIKEHKHLIEVLMNGSKKEEKKEAKAQRSELERFLLQQKCKGKCDDQ